MHGTDITEVLMNLRQLEAFRATILSGSITEAARSLRISQPSVSRLISDLEKAVGFTLFHRTGRGLTPSLEAKTFYRGVEGMFVGVDRLQNLADTIRSTNQGIITIGTIQSIAAIELPKAVSILHAELEDVTMSIQSRNTPAILDATQMNQFDIGIVGRQPPYDGVDVLYQTAAPYVCLIPEEHPQADQAGPVDLYELTKTEEFVTFGGAFQETIISMDKRLSEKMQQRSRLSATNMPVAASLVREAKVFAIADPFSAEQAVRVGGVVFRPIKQDLKYYVSVVTAGKSNLSRPALRFVDILSRQLSKRVEAVNTLRDRYAS
jgi:DNA-binding transcriptional LysR family regulator